MLESVIKGLRKFEEYAVRLPDEFVHRQISGPVEWIEKKYKFKRNTQAIVLFLGTCAYVGYAGHFIPALNYLFQESGEAFSLFHRAFEEGFKQILFDEGGIFLKNAIKRRLVLELNALDYAPIGMMSAFDVFNLLKSRRNSAQNDGTVARDGAFENSEDVHSHVSLGGVVRPYLLGGSISAIAYGIWNGNQTSTNYGVSLLPTALSLYVRDDQSGGLLQRVVNQFTNPKSSKSVPQPQTFQVPNSTPP